MNQRDVAISMLNQEIAKDIDQATTIAKNCGLWDLLRLCYILRTVRVMMNSTEAQLDHADLTRLHLYDEFLKYAISLTAKHGDWTKKTQYSDFSNDRVNSLMEISQKINIKFETLKIFNFTDISLTSLDGKRAVIIDHKNTLIDPEYKILLEYGVRVEGFAKTTKCGHLQVSDLLKKFTQDNSDLASLFESKNEISLSDYNKGMLDLHDLLTLRMQHATENLPLNDHGKISLDTEKAFLILSTPMIFEDPALESSFSHEFIEYLRKNSFNGDSINDDELRFHQLTRRPFIMRDGINVFCPELIFDSITDNAHYTFLEGRDSREIYKTLRSKQFISRISEIASRFGYEEVSRDVYLRDGRRDIGDIDLILHSKKENHTLLIEGKNYRLPLDVYFQVPSGIKKQVHETSDWVSKVERRIEHLKRNEKNHKISGAWDYIIVSLMPEPISHYSGVFAVSIDEFDLWLTQGKKADNFVEFYNQNYTPTQEKYSSSDIKDFIEEGLFLARPLGATN